MTDSSDKYLIDTNILLRLSSLSDPAHDLIQRALDELTRRGATFYLSFQNIAEFWNVCTRPAERNGYSLSIADTNRRVEAIERTMALLPDSEQVYSVWRQLVVNHNVRGVQVHDARLVAIMLAYGIPRILTLNQSDFLRYNAVQAVHPEQVDTA